MTPEKYVYQLSNNQIQKKMELKLNEIEVRVLGALIEKELTTPEYYPLTLNALKTACNQKSNRHPVVSYDEKTVVRAIESLRDKSLSTMVTGASSRTPKYKHNFARRYQFDEKEVAALCVLMLRGPQTVGEIRGRSSRLYEFGDLNEVEDTLNGLMKRGDGTYVLQLPRQPGRKESRYAHLLGEPPAIEENEYESQLGTTHQAVIAENERIQNLEAEVALLKNELAELKQEFQGFKEQFD